MGSQLPEAKRLLDVSAFFGFSIEVRTEKRIWVQNSNKFIDLGWHGLSRFAGGTASG